MTTASQEEEEGAGPAPPLRAAGDGAAKIVDQGGRPLGQRALETRRKLLDSTVAQLAESTLRELRVIDIARRVGTSPATFYQYFRDVKAVVLCLAEEATREMPAILEVIEGDWDADSGLVRARAIVDAFIRHWDEHLAVLRARNQASDEGDEDFQRVRSQAMAPVLEALSSQIEGHQRSGDVPAHVAPRAAAAAMAAILERLAAYHNELERVGVTRADLVETSAYILHSTITGQGGSAE